MIKNILEGKFSDENQIRIFVKKYEVEISKFIIDLWEQQFVLPVISDTLQIETVAEHIETTQPAEIQSERSETELITNVQITDNQSQINMPVIFYSEEKQEKAQIKKNEELAFQIKNKQITFQNGKVNQEYNVDFDFEKLEFAEIAEVSFEGLENIGLKYSPEEKKITGVPTQVGDHKIEMKFKRKDWTAGKPLLSREVLFIINPDPKDLWSKNIPSEQDETKIDYPKPDSAKDFVPVAAKKEGGFLGIAKKDVRRKDMVAASQRGRSHAIEGKPRDDDFALYFDEETEWYIMIVADGAGSAKYSRKGSQIACNTAMNTCKEKLLVNKEIFQKHNKAEDKNEIAKILQETISNAVFEAYKAIEKEAAEKGNPIKDFSTTLLLSICKRFEYGWFVGAWWVGDGGIGIYDKESQSLKILGEPDGGEFAGQTRFLTMPDIIKNELYKRMRFEIVEDFTALILMTDGITDPKFETDANLKRIEKWNELWDDLNGKNEDNAKVDFIDNNEQSAEQLLKWLDFWSKGNHDDRTIAILF